MIRAYTSHWSSPILEDADAVIVGISRGTPRWSPPYRWRGLPELAPGDEAWSHDDEQEFAAAYTEQLEELGAEAILTALERIGAGRPVVLLCWEKPAEFCHRRILAHWLYEQKNVVVPELKRGMIRRRPDAPQLALFDLLEGGA